MEEILQTLLIKSLETGFQILAKAGFEDRVKDLLDRLTGEHEKKLHKAFAHAYQEAIKASGDEALKPLLEHQPFQEEVVTALLDPLTSFDVQKAADAWGEKLPAYARPLKQFFNTLENTLTTDEEWGPILNRYRELRMQREVQQAEAQQGLPVTERAVVQQVMVVFGDIVKGDKREVSIKNLTAQPGSNVVIADQVTQNITNVDPAEAERKRQTQVSLKTAYLNHVFVRAGQLALSGIDPKAASQAETRLNLAAVYTALLTQTTEQRDEKKSTQTEAMMVAERERQLLSAVEQLDRQSRLVLLGEPGSGKTTFVNFVAACLAGEALGKPDVNIKLLKAPLPADDEGREEKKPKPQPWRHGALLPVRVILRDFAARGLPAVGKTATARHIRDFILSELEAAALGDYAGDLLAELQNNGGLVMLDGLDEVPEADQRRTQIKQAVDDFAAAFPKCRLLVTSRTYAYQKQDWRLQKFTETILAPFSRGQIRQFVDRWYVHIAEIRGIHAEDAQGRAELLKSAIFTSDRLMGLAERPLLLTLMASLHAWRGGSLPEKREELYSDTVDLLLDTWESPKLMRDAKGNILGSEPSLVEWLKIDRHKMRGLLNELAFKAHQGQPELTGTADIPESELVNGLLHLSADPDLKPARLVEFLSQRTGLLIPHGVGVYTFPHRTFQEYLAACYLTDHDYPELVAELACQDFNRWREVALLAGAKAARGAASSIWQLSDALCYTDVKEDASEAQLWGAHLAGLALAENIDPAAVSERSLPKLERVQNGLVRVIGTDRLPALERARAGDSLVRLGDQRFDPQHWFLPADETLGFSHIPEGKFWMGSAEEDKEASADEKPQHELHLPGFYIGRYPVTVAQFRAYVDDARVSFDYWRFNPIDNRPVVAVTWHEAMAYCAWLDKQLKAASREVLASQAGGGAAFWQGLAEGKLRVSLPSEAQWEKAARGEDGSLYPWGDAFDAQKANMVETGIGTPSPVGCFVSGASPYGAQDMSGNVWEWTRSQWGKDWQKPDFGYPYDPGDGREALDAPDTVPRVLRGGAFDYHSRRVRCASRNRYNPYNGGPGDGFRLVVLPATSGL